MFARDVSLSDHWHGQRSCFQILREWANYGQCPGVLQFVSAKNSIEYKKGRFITAQDFPPLTTKRLGPLSVSNAGAEMLADGAGANRVCGIRSPDRR